MTTLSQIKDGELFWINLYHYIMAVDTNQLLKRIGQDTNIGVVRCVDMKSGLIRHLGCDIVVDPFVTETSDILSTSVDE